MRTVDSLHRVQSHAKAQGWTGFDQPHELRVDPPLRRRLVILRLSRGDAYVEASFLQDQGADSFRLLKGYGWRAGASVPSPLWGLDQNNASNLLRFLEST